MRIAHPIIALFFCSVPALAQEPADSDTLPQEPDNTLVDSILESLDEFDSTVEYGNQGSFIGLHGFFDLEFISGQGQASSFDLHHANLLLDVAVSEDADARVEFEWEHGGDTVEVDQVFLDYHPFVSDVSIRFGRFYAPFGMERHVWYPPVSKSITRPLVFREVVPGNWYETGAMVVWKSNDEGLGFDLEAAITNGLGTDLALNPRTARQARDNNNSKMLSGRMGVRDAELWTCGASFASGKYDLAGDDSFRYIGFDFGMDLEMLELDAEWVSSDVDSTTAPGGSFGRDGWYVQAFVPLPLEEQDFGCFARYDSIDPDDSVRNADDRNAASIGLRWIPSAQVTFKLEYQKVDHQSPGVWPGEDMIAFQAVLDF